MRKALLTILQIVFFSLIFTFVVSAQVDPTFNPVPSHVGSFSGGSKVQPDGKIIVYGSFGIIQGVQKSNIARLNPDGSIDNSFDCPGCDFNISSVVIQSDGKIIIAGYRVYSEVAHGLRIRRLNTDGSIDTSFSSPLNEQPQIWNPVATVWAVQPDGKIYVSDSISNPGGYSERLYRLNPSGSFDGSFANYAFSYSISGRKDLLAYLKVLPDGKLMIGGSHPNNGFLFRANPDGTKDMAFQSPILTSPFTNPTLYIERFDIQADGKIPLMGAFASINGITKAGIARLNADQSVDIPYTFPLSFESVGGTAQRHLKLQPDGKLLISGQFEGGKRLVRLNTDGSLDNSFNPPPTNSSSQGEWTLDASGRILLTANSTLIRLNTDGSLDTTFNITFGTAPGTIYSTAVQADGKIVFAGIYTRVNNIVRNGFARLNADGSLDNSFNSGNGFNRNVYKLVSQPDGKILATGVFETYNDTPRDSFARINADGSLDVAFNPTVIRVVVAALQADGKILIGGAFTTVNGTARTGVARLNADGSLDNSFNPTLGSSGVVLSLLVQADGKIMVGGIFSTVNGSDRPNLARLNSDGTLDTSFNAGFINSDLRIIERLANGKYLTSDTNVIVRRNADGSTDSSFQTIAFDNNFSIKAIVPQNDGTIIVGGLFGQVGNDVTKKYLVRLASNGALHSGFLQGGIDEGVWSLAKQADNKIIVVGNFKNIGGTMRFGIARLNYSPLNNLFDYDGDGRADISVFRPSENRWYIFRSSDSGVTQHMFGMTGDVPIPADYDGDGRTDPAIFRPSSGNWWYLSSINNAQLSVQWGQSGDIPRPSDFDGDGKTDFVVYRPSNSVWYRLGSTGATSVQQFGIAEDKPLVGDFDGDGKGDLAVYRPSTGTWWYAASSQSGQFRAAQWGVSTDTPAPADYDGDGRTDFAVYRPSTGVWYIQNSSNGTNTILQFGVSEDKPVSADYDGDGKADIALFRPSSGIWYLLRTTAGFGAVQWGVSSDIPTENAFIP